MMWEYGFGAWWMWIPGLLITLLIVGGIVALIVVAMRSSGASARRPAGTPEVTGTPDVDPARRILEERLARGEITPDEFRTLLDTLDEGRRK